MTDLLAALEGGRDHTGLRRAVGQDRTAGVFRNPVRPLAPGHRPAAFPRPGALAPERLQAELYGDQHPVVPRLPVSLRLLPERVPDGPLSRPGDVRQLPLSLDNLFAEIDDVILKYSSLPPVLLRRIVHPQRQAPGGVLPRLPRKLRLPFLCQTRPDLVDEMTMRRLREAGCDFINMAIEAGNPAIRNDVLRRNISDEKIVRAFTLARRAGIRTGSFNMIGLPGETMATVRDTINLNSGSTARPDHVHGLHALQGHGSGREVPGRGLAEPTRSTTPRSITRRSRSGIRRSPRGRCWATRGSSTTMSGCRSGFTAAHAFPEVPLPAPARGVAPAAAAPQGRPGGLIDCVYRMKRFLPSPGFFMKIAIASGAPFWV